MMKYWATAANEQSEVIYNQIIDADSLQQAIHAAKQVVPVEHHGSIDVTSERGNTDIEPATHSKLPWRLMGQNFEVGSDMVVDSTDQLRALAIHDDDENVARANAAFIVRAVNSHDQLVAALRAVVGAHYAEGADITRAIVEARLTLGAIEV